MTSEQESGMTGREMLRHATGAAALVSTWKLLEDSSAARSARPARVNTRSLPSGLKITAEDRKFSLCFDSPKISLDSTLPDLIA